MVRNSNRIALREPRHAFISQDGGGVLGELSLNLDRQVRKRGAARQLRSVAVRRARFVRVRNAVEEDGARVASEPIGPTGNHAGPTKPARGSIQSHPKARARSKSTITRTETAASAITLIIAARILLSRAVALRLC